MNRALLLLSFAVLMCGFKDEQVPKINTVIGIQAKNRDELVGYYKAREEVNKGQKLKIGGKKYIGIHAIEFRFENPRIVREVRFEAYSDIPKHSLPCADGPNGEKCWLVHYTDDFPLNTETGFATYTGEIIGGDGFTGGKDPE